MYVIRLTSCYFSLLHSIFSMSTDIATLDTMAFWMYTWYIFIYFTHNIDRQGCWRQGKGIWRADVHVCCSCMLWSHIPQWIQTIVALSEVCMHGQSHAWTRILLLLQIDLQSLCFDRPQTWKVYRSQHHLPKGLLTLHIWRIVHLGLGYIPITVTS